MTNREKTESMQCAATVTPYDVYGKLLETAHPNKSKTSSEKMDILFKSLDAKDMEVVGFGYPKRQDKFVGSDLVTISEGNAYHDYKYSHPRLIVRPKPPKKYRYITDGVARYPADGDYVVGVQGISQYDEDYHDYEKRLCFTREEVKD